MAARVVAARSTRPVGLVERLDREWCHLVEASTETVAAWALEQPVLTGCGDLDEVLSATRTDGDAVLLALLTRSRDGDALAARTVLQAMLGKMVLMALRTPGAGIEDFVTELWPVIATYPVQRRPRRIAANLALDTLKQVKGSHATADLSFELLPELVQASALARSEVEARRLGAEQVLARALELELIDGPTEQALSAVYLDGLTSAQAGASVGSSAEMVRYRCSRAEPCVASPVRPSPWPRRDGADPLPGHDVTIRGRAELGLLPSQQQQVSHLDTELGVNHPRLQVFLALSRDCQPKFSGWLSGEEHAMTSPSSTVTRAGTDGATASTRPGPTARARRNPRWIALGIAAVCLGALAAFFLYDQATGSRSVVVVTHAVGRGEVIDRTDLAVTQVGGTTGLQTVPADRLSSLVGTRTSVDLSAGSLLSPAAVAQAPIPAPDHSIVGVRLTDGRSPLLHLIIGSPVRLLAVPPEGAAPTFSDAYDDRSIAARVVSVTPGKDGQSVVLEVDVPAADAGDVAVLAAQNRLSAVRDAEG